jgi:Xaa-Pro dipeptidase
MSSSSATAPFLSMGRDTYKVSVRDVFVANRVKLMRSLERNAVVYLTGGVSAERNDTDHEPIFRQESYFLWLTGVVEPDCAVIISSAGTTLLIPKLPPTYATIMGKILTPDEWKHKYQVDDVRYIDDAEALLSNCLENDASSKLLLMHGLNSDSGNLYPPPSLFGNDCLVSASDTTTLFAILAECRVVKSQAELLLLQHVSEITSFAHVYTMRNTRPEMMEYQCESLFRHYCYYNYGSRLTGYTPICGCGPSASVLHYGHAGEPNNRQISPGDMLLMDMGAEYHGYGSDVTCSYPASGGFTPKQAGIYAAVLNAQRAVFSRVRPGVSWVDCHRAAEAAMLEQLSEIGIVLLRDKTISELVEMRLGAVFMPHGLGHFIGIDTHDVGGYLPGHPERIAEPGLKSLRTSRILQENMVLTNEPGCYFIDWLMDEALASPIHSPYLNAELLETYRGFGGVRLEDVFCVTSDGFVNYTLCPRTMPEVEHCMAGGKWPPMTDAAPELGRKRLTDPTPLPSPPSL